jgi:hydrogenase small subunit
MKRRHETLAAAGHQAEAALKQAMRTNAGKNVCVVEGAIPTKENGIDCVIGGRTAPDIVQDVAGQAGAVIAIGSCALMGRNTLRRPQPDECRRRARSPEGQDGGQYPRLSGHPLQLPGHRD